MNSIDIAKLCHEVNRAYCEAFGDMSQLPWEQAPEWARKSAISGVEFHLANNASPQQSHEAWLVEKARDGWAYGPVKDPEKKLHPCFVQYHMLPAEQRAKDYLFRAVVRTVVSIEGEKLGDGVVGDRRAEA